jgi:hypothetical protein
MVTPQVLTGILQPIVIKACKWEFIKPYKCFAHSSMHRSDLDRIALIPDPEAGFTSPLGPCSANKLAKDAFFDNFWRQIGQHISDISDSRTTI